ncbi:MAG: selenocysteine-specific translation elongation factor [Candidatus Rokubacteria bacterium]|nr:selenocysteine-specific translation elongation factor [Candidatus Rokubacteria bacterium]
MVRRHVVVGTAGHIDHGKSTLVRALTGIDPDRLKEEKERGITIDIGFAHLDLGDGLTLGVVDVPGHERFVKNMLAGVGGIDLVMLVIAADEGIMPQTREHLAICQLLRIKSGLVALTKVDMVEPEWLELVEDDVRSFLLGTFLEGQPIVPVSAKTGEGLDILRDRLAALARTVPLRGTDATLRLPIDRVFTIRGFGTVVTGTVAAGQVTVDERVEVYPRGLQAKVRGLQTHGQPVPLAVAGQRTAVNLQGVERAALERGDVLSLPGLLRPTFMLDATCELLADAPAPLKARQRVRFHIGTSEVMARVHLLDSDQLEPGSRGYVQLRLEAPVVALPCDRYVIRSYSPMVTIGGGELLDVAPAKARRSPALVARLAILGRGAPDAVIEEHLKRVGPGGVRTTDLRARTPFGPEALQRVLADLTGRGRVLLVDREWYVHVEAAERLREEALAALRAFHAREPLKTGMSKEELKTRLGGVDERVFLHLLDRFAAAGAIAVERDKVRLASHQVRLAPQQRALLARLEAEFRDAGAAPPSAEEAFGKLQMTEPEDQALLQVLLDERRLVRVKEGLYFHADALRAAEARVAAFLRERKEITPQEIKDLLGISRKYAIPLLEYLDAQRLTVRVGDKRVLRDAVR